MARMDPDLAAGVAAVVYAVTSAALQQAGVIDLGLVIAPSHTAGAFGVLALGRWYARRGAAGKGGRRSGD